MQFTIARSPDGLWALNGTPVSTVKDCLDLDFGFTPEGIAMINSYFSVMIAVVAVLAGASAARFYLVMTIYMQTALRLPPVEAGLVFVPLALTFVILPS